MIILRSILILLHHHYKAQMLKIYKNVTFSFNFRLTLSYSVMPIMLYTWNISVVSSDNCKNSKPIKKRSDNCLS